MSNRNSTPTRTEQTEAMRLSRAVLRLDVKMFGIVLGTVMGLAIFVMTNWLILAGGHISQDGEREIGPNLALLGQFFIGYRVTFVGSLIGFVYGFALGTITGTIISRLYNWFSSFREYPDVDGDGD
jgi:hypothetical protein